MTVTRCRPQESSSILDWALYYLSLGYSVIPVEYGNKRPVVRWEQYQTERPSADQVTRWFTDSRYNLAVVCGRVSGNLTVLDFDNKEIFDKFLTVANELRNSAPIVKTHRGIHVFIRTLGQTRSFRVKEVQLDVIGERKYVVVPPSVHEKGSNYSFLNSIEEPLFIDNVTQLITECCGKLNLRATISSDQNLIQKRTLTDNLQDVQGLFEVGYKEGERNEQAFKRATFLVNVRELSIEKALARLQEWNTLNTPPLPETELSHALLSAQRGGYLFREFMAGEDSRSDNGESELTELEVALQIMSDQKFATLRETDEIYYYQNGVYVPYAEPFIKSQIEILCPDCTVHFCNEVLAHIQRRTYVRLEDFDRDPYVLNLQNGLIDIRTGTSSPHSPLHLSRNQLPVKYDSTAKCSNIIRFLCEVQPDQCDRRVILEEMASCLNRGSELQKAYLWIGSGANGKSKTLALLERLLGKQNVSHITIQQLEQHRFAVAEIDGKLANIYADVSDKELTHSGRLKSIIAGDSIQAEKKNKPLFGMSPTVKHIFSANKLPEVYDDSDAFYRRWIITDWNQKFEGASDNPNILEKLTTEKELSGLLNLLIPLASKVLKTGRLSRTPNPEQLRIQWGERSDQVKEFISENLASDSNGFTSRNLLKETYLTWCRQKHYLPVGSRTFNEKLQSNIAVQKTVTKVSGRSVQVWKGIAVKKALSRLETQGSSTTSTDSTTPPCQENQTTLLGE